MSVNHVHQSPPEPSDAALNSNARVRFALLGDVEPKPDPVFTNLEKAVAAINEINKDSPLDFVASIGDIARNGTIEQYEAATILLTQLQVPLFGIMGNEEMAGGEERFLEYVAKWNGALATSPEVRFVKILGSYAFIFATASNNGLGFSEQDLEWLTMQIKQNSQRAIILFTHAPAQDVFPEAQRRVIPNEEFNEILRNPNLHVQFSGHIHMDLDSIVTYIADKNGVHHVHAPAIERTKIGDSHTPRIRVVTLDNNGTVDIQSYHLDEKCFEEKHRIQFAIR